MDATAAANRPTEYRPFSLNWALLGAMCAVIWSCYTTGSGIMQIIGEPWGAVFLTAVVQLTLATVSWFLGKDLAHWVTGQPPVGHYRSGLRSMSVYFVVFSLTFFISTFFSFKFYFNKIYGISQKSIDLQGLPQREDSEFMPTLRKAVEDFFASDGKGLLQLPITSTWSKNIKSILEISARPDEQPKLAKFLADISAARDALPAAQADLKKKQDARDKLAKDVDTKEQEAKAAQQQAADAQKAADDERAGRSGTGQPGIGPAFARLQAAAQAAQKRSDAVQQELKQLKAQFAQAVTALQDAKKLLEDLTAKIGSDAGSASAATAAGEIDAIGKLRDAFLADPRSATYLAVVGRCKPLLAALQQADAKNADITQASCESLELAGRLKARDELIDRSAKFGTSCSIDAMAAAQKSAVRGAGAANSAGKAATSEELEKAALTSIQGTIRNCFDLAAATGADISDQRGRFDFDVAADSPDRDEFTQTINSLPFINSTPSKYISYFAATISVVQDLFILVLSLFAELLKTAARPARSASGGKPVLIAVSDRENDTAEIRAAKTLLRLSMPARGSDSNLVIDMGAPSWASVPSSTRDDAAHTLRSLQRQGQVRALGLNKFELTLEAAQALENEIAGHAARLASMKPAGPVEPERGVRSAIVEPLSQGASATEPQGGDAAAAGPAVRSFTAKDAFDQINRSRIASPPQSAPRSIDNRSLAKSRSAAPPERSGERAAGSGRGADLSARGAKDPRKPRNAGAGASEEIGDFEARLSRSVGLAGTPPRKDG